MEAHAVDYWDRTNGSPGVTMEIPEAYVIEAGQSGLISRLARFGVDLKLLESNEEMIVETMTVTGFQKGEAILYGGEKTGEDGQPVRLPQYRDHKIQIETKRVKRVLPAGSYIATTRQPNALYLLALEPACASGFAALSYFGDVLSPGFEFPVYRIPRGSVPD
jgi:hypothetical protein